MAFYYMNRRDRADCELDITMAKTLIIVESPAKVKTISKYLGPDYVIRASYGHIFDLASGGASGIGVDVDNDFDLKFRLLPDKKEKLQSIIDASSGAGEIIIATD